MNVCHNVNYNHKPRNRNGSIQLVLLQELKILEDHD